MSFFFYSVIFYFFIYVFSIYYSDLRDKEPRDLCRLLTVGGVEAPQPIQRLFLLTFGFDLLQENGIPFVTEPQESGEIKKCAVQLQKETPLGLVDDICSNEVEKGMAGLCR